MEKYRKWTDQKVGVNPFVQAKKQNTGLIGKIIKLIAILIKSTIFVAYLPLFVLLYSIPITFLKQLSARLMLYLFGVYSIEDFSVDKHDKNHSCPRILSNHSCFLDILYYLYKYPNHSFVGFAERQNDELGFFVIPPLKAFLASLTNIQVFYVKKNIKKYQSLTQLIKKQYKGVSSNANLIIFYQKIRTNGKGTIKIDKRLNDELFQLGNDCLVAQIKYLPRNSQLFNMISQIKVVFNALGNLLGVNIKVRAIKQHSKDTHSNAQLRQVINSMASGPLIETEPNSYFQFYEFFKKTQKEGYKND